MPLIYQKDKFLFKKSEFFRRHTFVDIHGDLKERNKKNDAKVAGGLLKGIQIHIYPKRWAFWCQKEVLSQ